MQADESYVYNGKSQGVKVAGAEITADKYTITYETKDAWGRWVPAWEVKNAGDYRATLSIKKGVTGYQIAEGGNQVTFSIQPKLITGITWTDTELEYNGKDQKPVATANDLVGNDECDLTVTGAKKHAGVDYQASVTTVGNPNYKIDEKTKNVTTTFTIKKRPVTITWTNTTKTYSGGNMTPDVGLNLLGARVDGVVYELQGAATDVGKHEVKVVLLGDAADNYELPEDATTTFTISPKTITVKWSNNVSLEYTGEEQAPKVDVVGFIDSDLKNNLVSYAINGKESEIGNDYEASVVLTGEKAGNYSLPDDTSVKYSIVKIGNSMRLTGVERTKQYGESFKIGYYANYNTGKITYTSSDESVATIAEDGTITCVKPGKTTIKAVLIASDHHEGAEASFDLEVTKRKITISWGNNSLTYNGEVQAPEATANNVLESDKEKVKISVYGGQKDVGYNYWAWVVLAENDYYELARANNGKQFNIVQANSSITVDENTITKTYGAEPFGISYKSTGGTVEISLPWNNGVAHYDPWTKKIVIDHAGTVDITLNNKGDRNHSESSVTISLTVEPKTVSITWDKEDPISYEYDTHHHQPAATVNGLVTVNGKTVPCSAEVIVTGDKVSHGQARAVGKYKITVTGLTNKDYVLDENGSYSKEFEIVEVVEDTKLEVREGATTVYYLGVDEDKITLNLENIVIVEKLRSTNKNRETNVEARMIDASFDGSLLGKQTVIVNYNNLKLTFDIQIIKMIEPMWDDTQLVYNGDLRVPEFDVNGVESWKEIITLTHDNSVNASDAASTYSVTATINKDQEGKYVFVDNQYVSTCEYTIDPKPVTLTWNFEGAKTEYVDEIIPVYIFFVGHDKIAPTAQLKDTEEDILVLTTKDEEGNPVKDASAAGHYSIEASLSSTNYAFANDSETSVGYSVEVPVVTKIEVLKGYKADYYVGDAFDNENLKIKATLSDDSTQELAAKDNEKITVTGFDSATEGTKALTVKYEGQTAGFTVEVSKKQSTIDLKNGGDNVKATYGDAPIDLVFDAVNGEVIISSSNENVAKVENGKLVIVGAGEAEITLEIKDTDAVVGIKKSFTFEVERKVVGLEWSKENTFTEDGAKHSLTAKATGLVGTDSCDVIVEGGSAEVGTHTVTATGLSNKNYKLPEKASTTFVINAKEEPKQGGSTVEEPKKEEPAKEEPKKEEPAKEEPKKIKAEIKISEQFKSTYFVGEEFDPSGLTLEIENADGTKTTIPVTKDMVTGFNSQKVGDGEAVITYEDYTKKIPVTIVEKGEYTFSITTEANGDMHFVVIRKPGNDIAYSLYLGTYVDGKLVPADGIKTWSGSVHGLLFADYLKTLPAGDHKIEVVFKDGKAVATLTIPATTPASDASPVTGDTSSLTMWIILLAAAAAVLVAIRVYAAKRSNAE